MFTSSLNRNGRNWRNLLQNFDWNETREEVNRESRARIVLLGLTRAGKSTLFNQLCGWTVSSTSAPSQLAQTAEDFGLFCLVDLPTDPTEYGSLGFYDSFQPYPYSPDGHGPGVELGVEDMIPLSNLSPMELAQGADLLVYVLDGTAGVQPTDYRWVGRLRRLGLPLLVVLNKADLLAEADMVARRAEIEGRLATTVLAVSALTGANVTDQLLAKMVNTCPKLTTALGREIGGFRRQAAHRLIQRTALLNGLVALEPVPLIDLPVQMLTLTGLILRIGAVYDRPATEVRRREVVAALLGGLAARYGAQQLAKVVPVVGWLVSGIIGWSATWLLGRSAITYFEAGGDAVIDRGWQATRARANHAGQAISHWWQALPRPQLRWVRHEAPDNAEEGVSAPAFTSDTPPRAGEEPSVEDPDRSLLPHIPPTEEELR